MSLQCGIIGLPNVGKSTLFNCLTKAKIAAENYPFCTIEPNIGLVYLPDPRLEQLAAIAMPEKVVPTTVEFVDIAGLVAGASQGEGLGNLFLSHIRNTDAILHLVRCFDDNNIVHVNGKTSPLEDIAVIDTELALADLATIDKVLLRQRKLNQSSQRKDIQILIDLLERCKQQLDQGLPIRDLTLSPEESAQLKPYGFLTAKPQIFVANLAEEDAASETASSNHLAEITAYAAQQKTPLVTICAALEAELAQLDRESQQAFLAELGLAEPGLHRLIRASFTLLNLQTFFTVGKKEVRAWTIPAGSTAEQAAAVIHTDFARGFIRAQTISYEDFMAYRGEEGAKAAGKMRAEGRTYVVKDGDIVHFLFNV